MCFFFCDKGLQLIGRWRSLLDDLISSFFRVDEDEAKPANVDEIEREMKTERNLLDQMMRNSILYWYIIPSVWLLIFILISYWFCLWLFLIISSTLIRRFDRLCPSGTPSYLINLKWIYERKLFSLTAETKLFWQPIIDFFVCYSNINVHWLISSSRTARRITSLADSTRPSLREKPS